MEYTYQQSGQPAGNGKKPVTKRWWFWVIVVILGLGVIGSIFGGEETAGNDSTPSTSVTETQQPAETTPSAEPTPTATPDPTPEPTPEMTMGQKNALKQAHNYLDFSAFSRSGLIDQLEFEGYSTEDATFAVDNCGADWNEQAAKKAQDYLDFSSFSRSGLIDQLEFEGFTTEQAEYGVSAVGY